MSTENRRALHIALIGQIRRFVEGIRGRRVAREEVQPLLDVAVKERERLAYLEEIVAG